MPVSGVRIDLAGWLPRFDQWCARNGKTRSDALRELVAAAVGEPNHDKSEPANAAPKRAAEMQECRPITVRLVGLQALALRGQSAAAGMRAAAYVAAILSAVKDGRTEIAGKDAIEALAQSNYQLAWVGRNMRELVRKFDANGQSTQAPEGGAGLVEVLAQLTAHLRCAARVLSHIEQTRCPRQGARVPRRTGAVRGS